MRFMRSPPACIRDYPRRRPDGKRAPPPGATVTPAALVPVADPDAVVGVTRREVDHEGHLPVHRRKQPEEAEREEAHIAPEGEVLARGPRLVAGRLHVR